MALQLGDKGICERCRRAVPLARLNDKGFCGACAAPEKAVPEMALAASLDMEAIVKDVVEAGMLDMFRKKKRPQKSQEQAIEEIMALTQSGMEKTEDQGYKDMQEGLAAPWKELRKRFPKK